MIYSSVAPIKAYKYQSKLPMNKKLSSYEFFKRALFKINEYPLEKMQDDITEKIQDIQAFLQKCEKEEAQRKEQV